MRKGFFSVIRPSSLFFNLILDEGYNLLALEHGHAEVLAVLASDADAGRDEEGHHIGLQGRDLTVRERKGRPQSLDEAAALEQDAPVRKDVGAGDLGAGGSGAPEISFDPLEILFSWLKFQNIAGIAHSFTAPFLTVPLSVLAL